MKRAICFAVIAMVALCLCACGRELADVTAASSGDGYMTILWEGRTYVPFCVIPRRDCGPQIGIVDGNGKHKVFAYKGFSTDEWIVEMYVSGLMDNPMLLRERGVTDIPEGLGSEYEWNN